MLFIGTLVLLTAGILLAVCISVSVGQASIPLRQSFEVLRYQLSGGRWGSAGFIEAQSYMNIIWEIRVPRVIFAFFAGGGLAICGVVMQAIVQNPLADPYILGISSGASLGATAAIMLGFGSGAFFSQFGLAFGAFSGAVVAALAVMALSSVGGRMTSMKLVLSGSVISALCGSFSSFIVYLANDSEGMKTVAFWSMGSLASSGWEKVPVLSASVFGVVLFFLFQHRVLNTMLLGDEAAVTLGISLSKYRRLYMVLASLLTGVIVAYTGMIGFIGLIIPHIVRGLFGSDHKRLIPVSVLAGAFFLIVADIFSRILIRNVELPIGIITAIVGAPLFIYIIVKKGYRFGG